MFNIDIKWTGMSIGKVNLGLWAIMVVELTLLGQRICWPVS